MVGQCQAVAAWVAFSAASSGCEQNFSQLKRSPAELASSKEDTDRRLAVVIGSDPQFDQHVLGRARELYGSLLPSGRSRESERRPRVDSGRPGPKKPDSKQAWIRRRREAVAAAARQEEELHTPQRRPPAELPQSVAKEYAKQDALLKKRKAEAFLEGSLLPKEVAEEDRVEAAKRLKVDAANDKARSQKCKDITAMVKLTQQQQTKQWALCKLAQPVYLVEPGEATNEWQKLLRAAGVTQFTQEPNFVLHTSW